MKIIPTILALICLAGCAGYNTRIMGIDAKDFKGRNWKKIAVGIPASLIVHELSHWLYAETHGGGHFDFGEFITVMEDYRNQSHNTQQNFHRAGFIGQCFVGSILTAIPKTRHSDFTLGFNSFTTINTYLYTANGGIDKANSDIAQLDNGRHEGWIYTGIAGGLTYINLNKN